MDKLQKKLVEMLEWFHNFCVANNLKYYALEGTCLGMVRHKGIIPWDDDIDVGMPREDYDKLIMLMECDIDNYSLGVPQKEKEYIYPYAKLYDKRTTLIENTKEKLKRGIFIDIFPLDGAGNTLDEGVKRFNSINKKIKLICAKNCGYSKQRAFYKNAAIFIAGMIPNFLFDVNKIMHNAIEEASQNKFDDGIYVANFFGDWGIREVFKREWFGEPKLYDFENIKIYGPTDTHSYLNNLYGDYMTPPPVEKRVSHHDYLYLNLEEGYIKK